MAAKAARDLSNVPSVIELKAVNKWFGQFHVLSDINLDVKEGEILKVTSVHGSIEAPAFDRGRIANNLSGFTNRIKDNEGHEHTVGI